MNLSNLCGWALDKPLKRHNEQAERLLKELQRTAIQNNNMFETMMEASKYCSLGQITNALFDVGGQYRRNM